jgi:hypothetical protein
MSIDLTLPLIPLSGYQPPVMDPTAIKILSEVQAGTAFVNPNAQIWNGIQASYTAAITFLNGTVPGYTTMQVSAIKSALINVETAVSSFIDFTNLQSGVVIPSSGTQTPGLSHLMNVYIAITALDHQQNGITSTPVQRMVALFGSLFVGKGMLNQINDYMKSIKGLMDPTLPIPTLSTAIVADLTGFITSINQSQTNDVNAYNTALSQLQQASFAGSIKGFNNDPGGNYLIQKVIGGEALLNTLP